MIVGKWPLYLKDHNKATFSRPLAILEDATSKPMHSVLKRRPKLLFKVWDLRLSLRPVCFLNKQPFETFWKSIFPRN